MRDMAILKGTADDGNFCSHFFPSQYVKKEILSGRYLNLTVNSLFLWEVSGLYCISYFQMEKK